MLGDFLYLAPLDYVAKMHSQQADTIVAIFNYLGSTKSFGTLQRDVQSQVSRDTYSVTHNNDIFYVMPNEYDPSNLIGIDLGAASNYARFIAEFVLFGSANVRYLRYTTSAPNYQIVNLKGQIQPITAARGNGYRTSYMDFNNNYIYKLQDLATFFPPYFPSEQYKAYQQATWSLVAVVVLIILIAIIIIVILVVRNRNQQGDGQVTLKRRHGEDAPLRS